MSGPLSQINLPILAVFAFGSMVAMGSITCLAGYWPREAGNNSLRDNLTSIGLWCATALTAGLLVILCITASHLPLAVAIIVFGLALLSAPVLFESISRQQAESGRSLAIAILVLGIAIICQPWPFT